MPPRPRRLTEADHAEWAQYTRSIAPLLGRQPVAAPDPPAPPAIAPKKPRPLPASVITKARPPEVTVGGTPAGVDNATWQRLRGGKLVAARRLDLHGMTAQHAYHALLSFIRSAWGNHGATVSEFDINKFRRTQLP